MWSAILLLHTSDSAAPQRLCRARQTGIRARQVLPQRRRRDRDADASPQPRHGSRGGERPACLRLVVRQHSRGAISQKGSLNTFLARVMRKVRRFPSPRRSGPVLFLRTMPRFRPARALACPSSALVAPYPGKALCGARRFAAAIRISQRATLSLLTSQPLLCLLSPSPESHHACTSVMAQTDDTANEPAPSVPRKARTGEWRCTSQRPSSALLAAHPSVACAGLKKRAAFSGR
jgi:hypothetical protein